MADTGLALKNVNTHCTVYHALFLLEGEYISDKSSNNSLITDRHIGENVEGLVTRYNIIVSHNDSCQQWPLVDNKFKAFVQLNLGENIINVLCPHLGISRTVVINRVKLEKRKRFVRVVYIKCSDSEGSFDAPENTKNDLETAKQKLRFNARLLQSFTAHDMYKHGFGFQTFQLEENASDEVLVHVLESKLTTREAHGMKGSQLYEHFSSELKESSMSDPHCKFLAFMSCTRYDPPEKIDETRVYLYVKAHTALGGGKLGLFGTGGLHTWADDVNSLRSCFTNATKIDKTKLFDDSAGRGTYWANYSTTLGAATHELGHCFDLAHTPEGIMARGFDDMHLFATLPGDTQSYRVPARKRKADLDQGVIGEISSGGGVRDITTSTMHTEKVPPKIRVDGSELIVVKSNSCSDNDTKRSSDAIREDGRGVSNHQSPGSDGGEDNKITRQPSGLDLDSFVNGNGEITVSLPSLFTMKEVRDSKEAQDIFSDHRAHWYRSSAVLLHYNKWFNDDSSDMDTDDETTCLQINWSRHVKGPVGNSGGCGQATQSCFDDVVWSTNSGVTISGYAVYYGKYINALKPIITPQRDRTTATDVEARGKITDECSMREFLLEDGEYLTSVEVRAGAWIDAIRLHSNMKSSIWFGGLGGNWSKLTPSSNQRIMGFFGTYGNYLGSLGILVKTRETEVDVVPGNEVTLQVEATRGVRLIEMRGDKVLDFWEFLGDEPPTLFYLPKITGLCGTEAEKAEDYSIFVEDDTGNVCESGLKGFCRFSRKSKEKFPKKE